MSRTYWIRAGLVLIAMVLVALGVWYFRNPGTVPLSWDRPLAKSGRDTRPVTLYFGDPSRLALVAESREILVATDREGNVTRLVTELLRGSLTGNVSLFRGSSRVRTVFFNASGNLVLDFTGSPLSPEVGETECELALRSLMRSVSERFPEIGTMSLLVDGVPISRLETRLALPTQIQLQAWLDSAIEG